MKTFRFLDFKVYKDSKLFHKGICILVERLATDFALKNQLYRASLSVCLNIAEGSAKSSDKEFARFLEISIASLNEVVACLDIMSESKKISDVEFLNFTKFAEDVTRQLGGFIKKLRQTS